jgi:Tol biopolymer transport system component
MKIKALASLIYIVLFSSLLFGQFGQNKVQYKEFTWYYIQTSHFDIYFSQDGSSLAEFTAKAAEDALASIQNSFNYKINNRIAIIVYNSQNDFQETNVTDQYLSEGIEGFTELFKNRVVIQFMGSHKKFRHLIHHELVHAVINDMFYGGSLQNIISSNISVNIPLWFNEGMAEYQALGWDVDTDMFIRDAAINEYLPDIQQLGGYFAYRGGQAVFYYIAEKYGEQKIGEIINKLKSLGNADEAFKSSIGLSLKELNERWKKDIKKRYWPDIASRKDPDEYARRLTDHREDGGFYNTSPTISPQGDKIAFISNRNYYFDVFLMDAIDGRIIKKLVEGNRTADFEELNILTPGLTWSPDGKYIALSVKRLGWDAIYIINVDTRQREILNIELDGIKSVTWSPDGKFLAFIGHTPRQSDVYIYDFNSKQITNLTEDVFTDDDPAWSPDSKIIYFASDRTDHVNAELLPNEFRIYNHNYQQHDIYSVNIETRGIERITDMEGSDETSPVVSPDGNEILFISDVNGINNIYKLRVSLTEGDTVTNVSELRPIPVTNSLNGVYQLSTSRDGKKLTFSTLYQSAFNIFMLNNPFETDAGVEVLEPTVYIASLIKQEVISPEVVGDEEEVLEKTGAEIEFHTGEIVDSAKVYGDSIEIDFDRYVFGDVDKIYSDTTARESVRISDNLDEEGNYKVNKYKITFSPDIVYANAGYNTLYGLQGTTVISFSDVLGNHRLIGVTSLQIDLKNSDYGLAYYYLPKRINYGLEGFHTARFVSILSRGARSLHRFRNFGANVSASYPLNRFYRLESGLSWLNVSKENLSNPMVPSEKVSYFIPSLSFVHDNVLWGYTSPIDGSRYRYDVMGNPGFGNSDLGFYSLLGDYRTYFRFWNDYSFAWRLSGGYSGGNNPQRFFLGGIENWINRTFATTDIPIETASDFAFLTAALPMRGFDYAEQIGTKYAMMNMEFRFPLIRYLVTGALPILFSNILGTAFIDVGSAWNQTGDLKFFRRNENGRVTSNDLLMGTGFGARVFFLYFLVRFDVAWAYHLDHFSSPKFYLSLGADF